MAATTQMNFVSPAFIEGMRRKAVEAMERAYKPQPVKQPDGSVLMLCWSGRIQRAIHVANQLYRRGEKQKAQAVYELIRKFDRQASKAVEEANRAMRDYVSVCTTVDKPAENIEIPAECDCVGCQLGKRQQRFLEAEAQLRRAVFALLGPEDIGDEYPILVDLVEAVGNEPKRKKLWQLIENVARAQKEYGDAARAFDVKPDWLKVFSW